MTDIGTFTPEQARMLWQDYLERRQLPAEQIKHYPQRREVSDVSPHRVFVKNTEAEAVPPFGCMRITGIEDVGAVTVLQIEKPSNVVGDFVLNGPYEIDAGGNGWGYRHGVVLMLGDTSTTTGLYGPTIDSWEVSEDGGPFTVYGRDQTNTRTLLGRVQAPPDLTVVLDATLAAATNALTSPATVAANVLQKNTSGNLEDAGYNITVTNRFEHIELEQYTLAVARWIDAEWRVISADCEALGSWP